jgi:hypothetical protein
MALSSKQANKRGFNFECRKSAVSCGNRHLAEHVHAKDMDRYHSKYTAVFVTFVSVARIQFRFEYIGGGNISPTFLALKFF